MPMSAMHQQIKENIIEKIEANEYAPQSQLPTEAEFCDTYGVSRTTVRTALQQLSQEGYVVRRQGQGTFVAEPKIRTNLSQTVTSFTEQVTSQGKKPFIKVLSLQVIPADEELSHLLHTDANAAIQKVIRVRYVDEKPLQYEIAYVPWTIAPGITEEQCSVSLYSTLRDHYSVRIARTEEHLQLTTMDPSIAKHLASEEQTPCFYLETLAYLEDGTIAEHSQTYFHGERASFQIERHYS
ncbi:transcriptional regulator, GntR family [Bacillus sp. JCM 19047]|nr:transcriptional regulator, GntR family [Bacillus sp. JCM 19047]